MPSMAVGFTLRMLLGPTADEVDRMLANLFRPSPAVRGRFRKRHLRPRDLANPKLYRHSLGRTPKPSRRRRPARRGRASRPGGQVAPAGTGGANVLMVIKDRMLVG